VRSFVTQLQADPRFADILPKEAGQRIQPFRKMLVKVKHEIIRMNPCHPSGCRPRPAVPATTVKRWLDKA